MTPGQVGDPETAIAIAVAANAVAGASPMAAMWAHVDIGAPINVLFWIIMGAGMGVWNKRFKHKGNLTGAFFASFALTIGVIVWIPQFTGYRWDNTGLQAAAGLLLSFTSQNWGPRMLRWIDKGNITDIRGMLADWLRPSASRRTDDESR